MTKMEILWGITGILVPAVTGIGVSLAMSDASPREFMFAHCCIWVSAIILSAMTLYWLFTTEDQLSIRVIVGFVVGLGVFVLFPEVIRWVNSKEKTIAARNSPPPPKPPLERKNSTQSLHDLFAHDFGDLSARLPGFFKTNYPGGPQEIEALLLIDLNSNAKWMSFYIPLSAGTYEISKSLADSYKSVMREISERQRLNGVAMRSPGDSSPRRFGDTAFTGQVYIYHEMEMEPRQVADLIDLYKARGLTLQLRSQAYRAMQSPKDDKETYQCPLEISTVATEANMQRADQFDILLQNRSDKTVYDVSVEVISLDHPVNITAYSALSFPIHIWPPLNFKSEIHPGRTQRCRLFHATERTNGVIAAILTAQGIQSSFVPFDFDRRYRIKFSVSARDMRLLEQQFDLRFAKRFLNITLSLTTLS